MKRVGIRVNCGVFAGLEEVFDELSLYWFVGPDEKQPIAEIVRKLMKAYF